MENNLTTYEAFQIEHYGNIIPSVSHTPESEMYESGLDELDRLAEWTELQAQMEENL